MSIHDVPRGCWADGLEAFSRAHRGWLASLVTVGRGPVLLSYSEVHPLESITLTPTDGVRVGFQGGPTVLKVGRATTVPGTCRAELFEVSEEERKFSL